MTKACLLALAPILACFALPSAQAQAVYKCSSPKGETSYQSIPCSEGETSLRRYATPSRSNPTQTISAAPARPGQRRVQVRYTTTAANEKCDSAKALRTAALGAAGAQASADMRGNLDQQVNAACR
ncbi:DUF4124 domain-containing protein [Stenotrophomonas terrae]|uniref:DUF4124 domain-containing protein n=1 Tax=Stenotrophomonas terrae TaxID=405446 RepID=UPI00070EF5FF|nr:DUF4124 domain-containing protein [Stenotrophomonas terrae]